MSIKGRVAKIQTHDFPPTPGILVSLHFVTGYRSARYWSNFAQTNSSTGALYFLQDHLGSTVALTNAAGSVVERTQYDAFGQSSGSSLTRYGFTGRERESANGLMYYRARWYDPQPGRFMSEDPIGLTGGPNLYEYAYNNPLQYVDPTGNQGWETAGALAGGGTLAGGSLAGGGTAAGAAIAAGARERLATGHVHWLPGLME